VPEIRNSPAPGPAPAPAPGAGSDRRRGDPSAAGRGATGRPRLDRAASAPAGDFPGALRSAAARAPAPLDPRAETLLREGLELARLASLSFRRALRVNPRHVATLCNFAFLLEDIRVDPSPPPEIPSWRPRESQLDEAEAMYRRALAANPTHVRSLLYFALFKQWKRRDADGAEALFRAALNAATPPGHTNTMYAYAQFLANGFGRGVSTKAGAHKIRGGRSAQRSAEAEAMFARALAADPTSVKVVYGFANFLRNRAAARRGTACKRAGGAPHPGSAPESVWAASLRMVERSCNAACHEKTAACPARHGTCRCADRWPLLALTFAVFLRGRAPGEGPSATGTGAFAAKFEIRGAGRRLVFPPAARARAAQGPVPAAGGVLRGRACAAGDVTVLAARALLARHASAGQDATAGPARELLGVPAHVRGRLARRLLQEALLPVRRCADADGGAELPRVRDETPDLSGPDDRDAGGRASCADDGRAPSLRRARSAPPRSGPSAEALRGAEPAAARPAARVATSLADDSAAPRPRTAAERAAQLERTMLLARAATVVLRNMGGNSTRRRAGRRGKKRSIEDLLAEAAARLSEAARDSGRQGFRAAQSLAAELRALASPLVEAAEPLGAAPSPGGGTPTEGSERSLGRTAPAVDGGAPFGASDAHLYTDFRRGGDADASRLRGDRSGGLAESYARPLGPPPGVQGSAHLYEERWRA
jgi:tetratricopeptide (TPR) repeat protein